MGCMRGSSAPHHSGSLKLTIGVFSRRIVHAVVCMSGTRFCCGDGTFSFYLLEEPWFATVSVQCFMTGQRFEQSIDEHFIDE